MHSSDTAVLSFVIPVYNERANVAPLAGRINAACAADGLSDYEVIFVENGSEDGTDLVVRELHRADRRIKMVQLARNFGYQGALTAGLNYARGEWVAVLDGDQQDPPELIMQMLARAREGYEVVYGVRRSRREGVLLRLAYWTFYRLWRMTADIDVPLDASEFAVLHRRVVDVMKAMPERQRFTRGLRAWSGFRQTGFDYERDSRRGGHSKFGLGSNLSAAMDGIFAYSTVPIRMTIVVGLLVTSVSLTLAIVNTVAWAIALYNPSWAVGARLPRGLTQIFLFFSILFGMVLLALGVIGEYVGRVFEEVKSRPHFIVRDMLL
jgi:dolichol-phosphate mannosyltransferase